ncbi:hypothetical protein J2790_000297 [Paenarthrobacter nicotinovorans]|uniref:hypothetical protein n=1 Tax=Micrococcaceae TaxID=1268 RepID=UPI000876B87C|nr:MULTISPECIES: hypothetical protein [Micrococcaceae]MDR6435176.1 hypothetical protein [Paenarthrobacter nicotinovorans]SCZ49138.1 hypothetical protein SAMN02799638_00035 [Arthrobacter sp. UNCCL28]
MNQLSPGPHDTPRTGPETTAGTATAPSATAGANPDAAKKDATKYDAVAGPFTIRDLTVFGSALLMFVASLLPMFGERYNLWNLGNLFFLLLGIILPLVVVALFVARRLKPGTVVRVGSLSVDQFASVTASFAFPLFFLTIANSFNGGVLLGLIGSVGLLAATVLAPHLPWLSADFKGRAEVPAHVVAREAAIPSRKPAAPKAPKEPVTPAPAAGPATAGSAPGFQAPAGHASSANASGSYAPAANAPGSHDSGSQAAGSQGLVAGAPGAGAGAATSGAGAATSGASASAVGGVGAGGTGATGSSPFAPPANYGTASSDAAEAPAVVHSADVSPAASAPEGHSGAVGSAAGSNQETVGSPAPGVAAPAPAGGSAPSAEPVPEAAKGPEVKPEVATSPVAAEPATTQHAAEPATTQHAAQQPAAQQPWAATMATPIVSGDTRRVSESIGATVDPASRPDDSDSPQYEAFWFAVAQPRTAYDEHTGTPAFTIEPGGWVLALEDRGHEFLVQDTDGKVGVLRELSNIERG